MTSTVKIPEGWEKIKLSSLIDIKHGFAFKGEYISDINNGKVLLTPGNFLIGGGWKEGKKRYTGEIPSDYILKGGDLVVTMTDLSKDGDTLGYSALVPNDESRTFLHNQRIGLVTITNEKIDKIFLYYLMRNREYQKYIVNFASGSTVRHTSPDRIRSYEFFLPTKDEQKIIAKTLSSFDDKIELLRAENQTLEEMGQTLFKEWFGKYKVGDELPDGWKVGKIENIFDYLEGPGIRNWQYTESGTKFINIRLIQDKDILVNGANFVSDEEAYGKYKHFHLEEKDLVLSTSGTLGKSAIVRKKHLPLLLNTSVIRFRPLDKKSYGYMYLYLSSQSFLHQLESMASGSVQLNFGPMHLKQIEMIIPDNLTLEKFCNITNQIFIKITKNLDQIDELSKTRDQLLPKLMSGEVRVEF